MIRVRTYEGSPWAFYLDRDDSAKVAVFTLLGRDEAIDLALAILGHAKGLVSLEEIPQGPAAIARERASSCT